MTAELKIGVLGTGAVGCWLGGELAAGGADVVLVGRQRIRDEIEASGLTLEATRRGAPPRAVHPSRFRCVLEATALADRDVVLCCVKSAQTAEAAAQLAGVLRPGAVVISMQNGMRNPATLRAGLPDATVLGGIFGFNVVGKGGGRFRRATTGPLAIERVDARAAGASVRTDPRVEEVVAHLLRAGEKVVVADDIVALQWSKLIMNLGNAVSALTDRPTQDLLFNPGYRRILAALMQEGIDLVKAGGLTMARLGPLPASLFPRVLRLPTPLLRVVASLQVDVDPEARSSMWEDLTRGRPTEIDDLNAEIVRLAATCGARAPLNERIIEVVRAAEAKGAGSPAMSADALWAALHSSG